MQTCWSNLSWISNVYLCQWEHHTLIQTGDMSPVLLPSHSSSANSHVSVKHHPQLSCSHCLLQYLSEKEPLFKLFILALAYVSYKTKQIGNIKHGRANMSGPVIIADFSVFHIQQSEEILFLFALMELIAPALCKKEACWIYFVRLNSWDMISQNLRIVA